MKSKNAFISTENLPLVLSVAELASVLNIGLNTAYKLVSSGQIRARRIWTQDPYSSLCCTGISG